jgi:hypothetical protein
LSIQKAYFRCDPDKFFGSTKRTRCESDSNAGDGLPTGRCNSLSAACRRGTTLHVSSDQVGCLPSNYKKEHEAESFVLFLLSAAGNAQTAFSHFDPERNHMNIRLIFIGLAMAAALGAMPGTTRAQIFVTNENTGTIGEYTTSGVPVNPALITGLSFAEGIAVSGGNLFVVHFANDGNGTIGEYTTSGAPVNPALITGLSGGRGIAVSGGNLFVTSDDFMSESSRIGKYTTSGATVDPVLITGLTPAVPAVAVSGDNLFVVDAINGFIAEYTTSGALVNPALISGLNGPSGIAVSGGDLFVVNRDAGTIGEYTTSGATVNAALVSGLNHPNGIAVSGGNLFVTNNNIGNIGTIGEYTTSGATVNAALVSGLNSPVGIAVVSASVPDASSTWTLLLFSLTATFGLKPLLRRPA